MNAGLWVLAAALAAQAAAGLEERVEVRTTLPASADVAAFATTLDTRDLASRGADLADVLRQVPGARVRRYGGLGQTATLSLRSSTGEQVTVLVDGVAQNRALGGAVDLAAIPATQVERVTVYRGFGPVAAGPAGIGGVVDIRTVGAAAAPGGQFDLLAGELGTARLSGGFTWHSPTRTQVRVGFELLDSEGDFLYRDTRATPFDAGDDVVRRRRNNGVESGHLLLQGVWQDVVGGNLTATARLRRRDQGIAGVDSLPTENAFLEEARQDLSLSWRRGGRGHFQGLELLADGHRERQEFVDRDIRIQDRTTRLEGGGIAAVLRLLLARHRILVRADGRREEAAVRDTALALPDRGGARRHLLAVAIEDVFNVGELILAPSLRVERRQDDFLPGSGGVLPPPSVDSGDTQVAGKIGLSHPLVAGCSARGSLGRFFRSPSLVELFGDRGFVAGNPGLRPESGIAVEAGVSCAGQAGERSRRLQGELVAFAREVDDLIYFRPVSPGLSRASNLPAARVLGLEAAATLLLPAGFSVSASGTLQEATDRSGGPADGRPLLFQPQRLGFVGLTWDRRGWQAGWEITYVGGNSTDALDTAALRLPSRVMHDVTLARRFGSGVSIGMEGRNLLDRRTLDVIRYPLPGRVFLIHLGWQWPSA